MMNLIEKIRSAVERGTLRRYAIDDRDRDVRVADHAANQDAASTGIVEAASAPYYSAIICDGDMPLARQHGSVHVVGQPVAQRPLTAAEAELPTVRLDQWCGTVTVWHADRVVEFDGRY